MAEIELNDLKLEYENNEKRLKLFLLPKDEADKKNVIIEIRAGTGGLEASLFASDLFKMYEKVSQEVIFILPLSTKVEFIEFKEFQILKRRVEFILLRQQLPYFQRQRKLI